MAEKEERISIELLKDDFCASCDNRGKLKNCCCYEKQEYDERYQKSIPHQDAIERMAKAICRKDNCLDSCAECILGFGSTAEEKEQFCQKQIIMSRDLSASYMSRAEAALNALLEEDNA